MVLGNVYIFAVKKGVYTTKMKRFWVTISCSLISILLMSTVVLADVPEYQVGDVIEPPYPVIIVEGDYASSEYYQITRDLIGDGWSKIKLYGSLRVLIASNTLLHEAKPKITNEMFLMKYDPATNKSTVIEGPYRYYAYDAGYNYCEKIIDVGSTGYYYTLTYHTVGTETKVSQSPAIHVSY